MVMNAFDTNFDGENEVYAVNTVAHAYAKQPIRIVQEPAGPHLSRQRRRVRPDQLVPPARQFLRLFRPGHDADADAEDGRPDHAVPGAARHPRIHLQGPRAGPLHVPRRTSRNSPNSAGSACSTSWRPWHERCRRRTSPPPARRRAPARRRSALARRCRSPCSALAIGWLLDGRPAEELRQWRAAGRER